MLKDQKWKFDIIPEIYNGKNVADFIDLDIQEKLDALEAEEERLIAEGFYESEVDIEDEDDELIREAAKALKFKKDLKILEHKSKTGKNRTALPKKILARRSRLDDFENHLKSIGNTGDASGVLRSQSRRRSQSKGSAMMDIDRAPSVVRDRSVSGLRNTTVIFGILILAKSSCYKHDVQGTETQQSSRQTWRIRS